MNFDVFFREFITKGGYKLVLQGLYTTLLIAVLGLIIGFLFGTLLAIFKLLPNKGGFTKFLKGFTGVYITLFRGTPMVVQLLLFHFVIFPALSINIPPLIEGVIAFGMNSAAYVCEIMRGGIQSVEKGQTEAGRALGLSYSQTMLKIVIPQAFKNVTPTLGNEFIALLKETSVVSFIAIVDVTRAFQSIANSSYQVIIAYIMLALVYLILVIIISQLIRLLERRLKKSD